MLEVLVSASIVALWVALLMFSTVISACVRMACRILAVCSSTSIWLTYPPTSSNTETRKEALTV
eukprot:48291-Amphidinium_carterae.1